MSKITDYFAAERYIRRRLLLLMFGGGLVLLAAVLAFENRLLSPRAFVLVLIAYVACLTLAASTILRKVRALSGKSTETADDETVKRFRKRIRRLQFGVAFFAIVLVYALWETRNDPWPPRLVGATINLLFQTVMIQSIRRMQRQLKQETADPS